MPRFKIRYLIQATVFATIVRMTSVKKLSTY
ncbi:hypothetical protein Q31b_06140 [Novipirellula aureliae]|uniref:Uncharacterized protein n=1 Tax=Novipirellula aureliae TaxID=2527966 RepID=A0A5C6E8W4_9BACT|nr:hypothetical protein Q31b_06140 [Novipirellula aureliae]